MLKHVSIDTLHKDVENRFRGTGRGRRAVRDSIENYGFGSSVVLDKHGNIVSGNTRYSEALEAGFEEVLVVQTDGKQLIAHQRTDLDLTQKRGKARKLSIADNFSSHLGFAPDLSTLAEDLRSGLELPSSILTEADLEAMLAESAAAAESLGADLESGGGGLLEDADPDEIPEDVPTRVRPGEIWGLGRHRLLCADNSDTGAIRHLMDGREADLCFTSPPYLQQRDYGQAITDWMALMQGAFSDVPMAAEGQVLVNLGMVHREGEWLAYWDPWIAWMRETGWRRFGWYVWDQGPGLPGDWNGRLAPAHEFIFHFNRVAEKARKTKDCLHAGTANHGSGLRQMDGSITDYTHAGRPVQEKKIPDSVVRVMRHKARGIECEHPAVFPVALAAEMIEAFSDPGDLVYDPFAGSGSAILGSEQLGRLCYSIDIEPRYCDIALARFEHATGQTARRID